MTASTYPATIYDDGAALLRRLGSFWYRLFADYDVLEAYCASTLRVAEQTYLNYLEALNALALDTTPVWHTEQWSLLTIRESQLTAQPILYGAGLPYGRSGLTYGGSYSGLSLPVDFTNAPIIVDKIIDPDVTWCRDTHYTIDNGRITFLTDPFKESAFARRTSVAADKSDEQVLGMWVCQAEYDWQYVWKHWGYAFGVHMESGEAYRTVLSALLDAYAGTPTLAALETMVAAITGVPLIRSASETVEAVYTREDRKQLVTDKHVYDVALTATPAGSPGDTLTGGTPVSDAISVIEPRPGEAIDIPGIALDNGFVSQQLVGSLFHVNEDRPLEYIGVDADGYAEVRYSLAGFPGDTEMFWSTVHTNGKLGRTLCSSY